MSKPKHRKPDQKTSRTPQSRRSNLPKSKERPEDVQKEKHQQDLLDEGIEESFPASDAPAVGRVD